MIGSELAQGNKSTIKQYNPDELRILAKSQLAQKRPDGMPEIIGFTVKPEVTKSVLAAIAQSQDGKLKPEQSPDRS